MDKIAIDIALIPPEEIMDKAIEINSQFDEDPIKLNKENCLPHITLCMGVIEKQDLPKIEKIIQEISEKFSKLPLTIGKINSGSSSFEIKKNENLQKLHEEIMDKLSPYLSSDVETNMCFSPPPVVEKTKFWIKNFKDKWSYENFYPHITLGITKLDNRDLNLNFTASKIGICHLGNYCTCRKIFYSYDLR